jgi:ubiquinone/menaquinone biosynthesis C-methylase UbiE
MKEENGSETPEILPVLRSKKEAKQFYDRVSRVYDYSIGTFERKYAETALRLLSIEEGETVLEIGFGSGRCLKRVAESAGKTGKVYGIDISLGMLEVTTRRLEKAGLIDRVGLCCGDAVNLPYQDSIFDAVFMSYTLELFDTPEVPKLLKEVKRVLKESGRFGVVSISRENGESRALRLYEWVHQKWPKYVDCRPIYLEHSLRDAGYKIRKRERLKLLRLLPLEIVVAVNRG